MIAPAGATHPATRQARLEDLASPRQPALHGTDRPAEGRGGLVVGAAFEVAHHDRGAILLRQAVDGLVEGAAEFAVGRLGHRGAVDGRGGRGLLRPPLRFAPAGPNRHPHRDPMKPRAKPAVASDRAGLANEQQERRLKSVVGRVVVAEYAAADGQDHRPVPRHQSLERHGVPLDQEAIEQVPIVEARDGALAEEPG